MKKKIFSIILSLSIIYSSVIGLTVASSAVEPVNRVNQSYKNTEYSSFIVPADTIPSGSGYQQVEFISKQSGSSYFVFPLNLPPEFGSNHLIFDITNNLSFVGFGQGDFIEALFVNNGNPYSSNSIQYYNGFGLVSSDNKVYGPFINFSKSSSNTSVYSNSFVSNIVFNYGLSPYKLDFSSHNFSRSAGSNYFNVFSSESLSINDNVILSHSYPTSLDFWYTNAFYHASLVRADLLLGGIFTNFGKTNYSYGSHFEANSYGQFVCFQVDTNNKKFVPCYRTSDGFIGFYNLSDNTFLLPNSQEGLYAGPDVVGVTEPTIIDQSSDYSIYLTGASPELFVNATTEIGNITYQWQKSFPSPLGYTEWEDIENATDQFYTPPAFDDLGIYKFRCKVGSVLGSSGLYIYSEPINIEVVEADPDIPVIVTQPDSKVYYNNIPHLDDLFIEVAEMEEGQITYQWQYRDDNNIWRDIQGATSSTLNVDNRATHIGSYYYRCNVSNTLANVTKNVTSNVAEIKIIEYNSFEDFWRIFFNGGNGSINSGKDLFNTFSFGNLPDISQPVGLMSSLFSLIPSSIWSVFGFSLILGVLLIVFRGLRL